MIIHLLFSLQQYFFLNYIQKSRMKYYPYAHILPMYVPLVLFEETAGKSLPLIDTDPVKPTEEEKMHEQNQKD